MDGRADGQMDGRTIGRSVDIEAGKVGEHLYVLLEGKCMSEPVLNFLPPEITLPLQLLNPGGLAPRLNNGDSALCLLGLYIALPLRPSL